MYLIVFDQKSLDSQCQQRERERPGSQHLAELEEREKSCPQPEPRVATGEVGPSLSITQALASFIHSFIKISKMGVLLMARRAVLSPPGKKIYCPNLHFIAHNRIKMIDFPARLTASFHSY